MNTTAPLGPAELEHLLPHRGCNMLVDEVVHAADGSGAECRIELASGSGERGREIFTRRGPGGELCWQEPFLAEMVALAGISLFGERLHAEGCEGVYSAISRVTCSGLATCDTPLHGTAKVLRDRGGFVQFRGELAQHGSVLMAGEFMSGSAPMQEVAGAPVRPETDPVAGQDLVADFGWKDPATVFVDRVRDWDPEARRLVADYTYPEDHPFVPGHFPDAALMMGVTQWTAILDAGWEAAARADIDGPVAIEGRILRPDGSEVVGVRGAEIRAEQGVPILSTTQRVVFREPVRPGDGLRVEVTVGAC